MDGDDDSTPMPDEASEVGDWAEGDVLTQKEEICSVPVEEWVDGLKLGDKEFQTTEDVPLPNRLVDQVIGQDAASIVVRKAAEQRRHVILMGDPGTGKSMLARSMTEFLPKEQMEDILVYRNQEDENEPKVRTVPAGRGERIIKERKAAIRQQRERTNKLSWLLTLLLRYASLI